MSLTMPFKLLDWIDDILKKIHKDASEKAKPKLQGVALSSHLLWVAVTLDSPLGLE